MLLLLDIALPDGCGWDVLRELRTRGREDVPVIVMSVLGLDARVVADQRCAAMLQKPFPMESLLRLVTRLTGYCRSTDNRSRSRWIAAH